MAVIRYLTDVEFDFGVVGRLPEVLTELGIDRPLLVSDPGLASSALMERVAGLISGGPAAIFGETPSNPNEGAVNAAADVFGEHGCDGLIALGGGSPMDLSKTVALRVTHDGPLASYAAVAGGLPRIRPETPPVIAIPTTAGTGSEVGRAALITMKDGRKLGVISPHLIPRRALCDPELTLGLPPALTAATGMDALAHCVESLLSPAVNPPAEAIALDGVARVARWIETATRDGGDREARWQMMMAALEGGLTFQKGLGGVHALSHPLGSLRDPVLHHGTLNAVPARRTAVQPGPRGRQVRSPAPRHGPRRGRRPGDRHRRPESPTGFARRTARDGRHRRCAAGNGRGRRERPLHPHQPAPGGGGGLLGVAAGRHGLVRRFLDT